MGSINGILNANDSFDAFIEEKIEGLDFLMKKIEKQRVPFSFSPVLYNDVRKYVEQAYLYDFNLIIEEFPFYQQLPPTL